MKKIFKVLMVIGLSCLFLANVSAEEEKYVIIPIDPLSATVIEEEGIYSFQYGDAIMTATCHNGQPEEEIHVSYTAPQRVVAFKYVQSGGLKGSVDWDGVAIYANGNYDYVKWLPHTVTETLILGQCQPCSVYSNNEYIPGAKK